MADDSDRRTVNKLTRKEQLFVDFYIQTLNATEAARLAKYAHPNTQGPRIAGKPHVEAEIESRLAKHHASAEEVLAVLSNHMRGSLNDFITIDEVTGEPTIDLKKARDAGQMGLLKEIDTLKKTRIDKDDNETITERVKIKLHDPQAAAVHLGKYHKLFTDKSEVSGPDGGPVPVTIVEVVLDDED